MAHLPGVVEWEQAANLLVEANARGGPENMPGSTMELFVSSISVNVERGREGRAPQRGPDFVAAGGEHAGVSLGGRAVLCTGTPGHAHRDSWAQVGGVSRLVDRWVCVRAWGAAVELGGWSRDRDARGPRTI